MMVPSSECVKGVLGLEDSHNSSIDILGKTLPSLEQVITAGSRSPGKALRI
jgi:hypothetical protein